MWPFAFCRLSSHRPWWLGVSLLFALGLSSVPLYAQQTAPADSAAVVEAVERYHAALESGDTATAMALLASDAVILESGGIESRAEYLSHHLSADMEFAKAVPRERGEIRVRVHGNTAWARPPASPRVDSGTGRSTLKAPS